MPNTFSSALYRGHVVHHRVQPSKHLFTYKVTSLLIDLNEIEALQKKLRLFSINRFNVFSFYPTDHANRKHQDLTTYVKQTLVEKGITAPVATIKLLCYPRILGYAFNPLSVYFCFDENKKPSAILYEVSNTFGGRHSYAMQLETEPLKEYAHNAEKKFYVSPFMPMDCTYFFRTSPPAEQVAINIRQQHAEQNIFFASFKGSKEALSDKNLLKTFIMFPLMTIKIMLGIHWEALRLWLKGNKLEGISKN